MRINIEENPSTGGHWTTTSIILVVLVLWTSQLILAIPVENSASEQTLINENTDFFRAMHAKNFSEAVVNFNKIIAKEDVLDFIERSYDAVNNFDCYMIFAGHLDRDKRTQIYSLLNVQLLRKVESYADICNIAVIYLSMRQLKIQYPSDFTIKDKRLEGFMPALQIAFSKLIVKVIDWRIAFETERVILPLVQRNNHIKIGRINVEKPYLSDGYFIFNNTDSNMQTLYCENKQLKLSKDNYVAPLVSCS